MLHSVWEYKNGRHVFRMGISRLVGVDKTLGDPNSFGASIVYSLPFLELLLGPLGPGLETLADRHLPAVGRRLRAADRLAVVAPGRHRLGRRCC